MANALIQEREWLRYRELLEVLAGQRGNGKGAALTVGQVGSIEEFMAGLKKQATGLSGDFTKISGQVEQINQTLDGTQDDVAQLGQQLGGLQGDISAAQQRLDSLNSQIDQFQQDIQGIRADAAAAQQSVNLVKQNVAAVMLTPPAQADVTAAPTAADFNGAMADIRAMYQNLQNIVSAISS